MSLLQDWVGVRYSPRETGDERPAMVRDGSPGLKSGFEMPPGLTLAELVKAAVLQTLDRLDGNRTRAAQRLGISVRTLQRKLKQWHREYQPAGEEAGQEPRRTCRAAVAP
jgi:DNA-binding NtrC family response regulator